MYGNYYEVDLTMATAPKGTDRRVQFALISNGRSPHNDNHRRILNAANALRWQTHLFDHSALCHYAGAAAVRNPTSKPLGHRLLDSFDLVWVLGLGTQGDFLDRAQILTDLPAHKLVNTAQGIVALHAKHLQLPHSPMAFSSNDPDWLCEVTADYSATVAWVVKPSAGSFGRGVKVAQTAAQLRELVELATKDNTYCVVQEFIATIAAGETRTLVLNKQIIGSYLRTPNHDFLANLSSGASATAVELSETEETQIMEVAEALEQRGIRFAAIDMTFPYLIEVNVANPGGLATLAALGEEEDERASLRFRQALASLLP